SLQASAAPALQPIAVDLELQLQPGELTLLAPKESAAAPMALGHLVTPLNFKLSTLFDESYREVTLNSLHLNSGQDLLDIVASGAGSVEEQDGQLEITIKSQLRPNLLSQPPLSGSGLLQIPLSLVISGGERFTLGGELQLTKLSLSGEDWGLKEANGTFTIEEELLLTPEQRLDFLYTLDTDPFQRVDYARIQPYLDGHRELSIKEISVAGKSIGPLAASLSIRQNLIHLQQLDIDLLGGHLAGQLYVDANPAGWRFGLLGRLSQIRLNELLQSSSRLQGREERPLNARVAIEYDLNRYLLEGRIDIGDISAMQLLQLLEVLDPEYQDEQLAQVRSLLGVAHPQWVAIDMRRGLMDLEVALSALPAPIAIKALPLTPLLHQFTADYMAQLKQLPLAQGEPEVIQTPIDTSDSSPVER
ncbi:MAG: hypothetical protein GQ470_00570, partial [Gammaproteobacteria bacterium]|nr:hypothetical protein [Gammaproteobacteria bacterium]